MRVGRVVSVLVGVALLAGVTTAVRQQEDTKRATVFLPRAVHLYAGSDVSVLGVRVGEVVDVVPEGDRVRVELEYEGSRNIPAQAQAALVSPTLVADRYIQLTPVYSGGPVLADGDTIPLARGQVPVELDEVFASLEELSRALGPDGANRDGALSDLITVGAENLDGNGELAGETIDEVSGLAGTLADNSPAIIGTVRNLQAFSTELAQRDQAVRSFTDNLAKVSGQLDGEREELGIALKELATALGTVSVFLEDNREGLRTNVTNLAKVSEALAKEKESIARVLEIGPLGTQNFAKLYNPVARGLAGRINAQDKYQTPALFICSLYSSIGQSVDLCKSLLEPVAALPIDSVGAASAIQPQPVPAAEVRVAQDMTLGGVLRGAR